MADVLCKIKIKIKDYYPKLKFIPYNNFDCIISYNKDTLTIPLKDIENNIFENEPEKINSDVVYNISLISHENKNLISTSQIIIPYIRFVQVIKIKEIKFEQQNKLILGNEMKEKIFGPGISVGSIFLKFSIEINGVKSLNSNILLNSNKIMKNNSSKFRNNKDFNINACLNYSSNLKKRKSKKNIQIFQTDRLSRKNLIYRTKESTNTHISINKENSKSKYTYTHTSPFTLKNNYTQQHSVQKYNKKLSRKNILNCFSPQTNLRKIYSNDENENNNNINLKKYSSKFNVKIYISKNDKNIDTNLSKCFSDISIREKKEIKPPKIQNRNNKTIFSQDTSKNSISINKETKTQKSEKNIRNHCSIEISNNQNNQNTAIKKISKKSKFSKKNLNNYTKKESTKNCNFNVINDSISKIDKSELLKYKTSKNFYKVKNDKSVIVENKSKEIKINLFDNKFTDLNYIRNIKNQEDLKNNLLSIIDYDKEKNKKIKQTYVKNINDFDDKYLLYKEKIVFENKKQYSLQNQNNTKDIRNFIHVKINSKYNNIILNKMYKIKNKELNILQIILNNRNKNMNPKKIIEQKLKQQKQIHVLLNLIRDLIKNYGNISHIYDDDNNKKILIKSLFLRYNIKEKEPGENHNLLDIYNKMIEEIKNKKHKSKLNIFKQEEFKAIKEEEENENDENDEEEEEKENNIKEENHIEQNEENKKENIEEINTEKNEENNSKINEENKDKEENNNIIKEGENMKENINNENINLNKIDKNNKDNKENNIYEIKENLINNIINLDDKVNTNNINNDLLNNKNIIINNFIINK